MRTRHGAPTVSRRHTPQPWSSAATKVSPSTIRSTVARTIQVGSSIVIAQPPAVRIFIAFPRRSSLNPPREQASPDQRQGQKRIGHDDFDQVGGGFSAPY